MQIVIDILEQDYERILHDIRIPVARIRNAIRNGKPLPKGHGDLIERDVALADSGLAEFHRYDDYVKMRNYLKNIPVIIEADKAEDMMKNAVVIKRSLCDSCVTKGCIFQSGIVRNHCDFYKAESEEV